MASHLLAMEQVRAAAKVSVSLARFIQANLYRDVRIFVSDPVHTQRYLLQSSSCFSIVKLCSLIVSSVKVNAKSHFFFIDPCVDSC